MKRIKMDGESEYLIAFWIWIASCAAAPIIGWGLGVYLKWRYGV